MAAGSVASRTPRHRGGASGDAHRRAPVGGAAYGTPENDKWSAATWPRTHPLSVRANADRSAGRSDIAVSVAAAVAGIASIEQAPARAAFNRELISPP